MLRLQNVKALDDAEKRIGMKLPARFRATYETKKVLTSCREWQIFQPSEIYRTVGGEYRIASQRRFDVPIDAVIVGFNGEQSLFLRVDGVALGESLWTWEHQETEPTLVARSLDALLVTVREKGERVAFGSEESFIDIACPFCAVVEQINIDPSGGDEQTFVEDCSSCCRARVVHVEPTGNGDVRVWLERG
jgi:hypothetical protein